MKHITIIISLAFFLSLSFTNQAISVEVERYTQPGDGSVNTWFITTEEGIVVIDFQRDVENASKAIAQIKSKGKPVKAMFLTHSHPDHVGGIEQFMQAFPKANMFASQATIDEIRNDTMGYQALTKQVLGEAAPNVYTLPNKVLKDVDSMQVAGLTIKTKELGVGESVSATVFYVPEYDYLFTGDIVSNNVTEFFLEKRTQQWLKHLDLLTENYSLAKTVFPGHGESGDASSLLVHTKVYIESFRSLVATELANNPSGLSDKALDRIIRETHSTFPDHPAVAAIPNLVELNAIAVAEEIIENSR